MSKSSKSSSGSSSSKSKGDDWKGDLYFIPNAKTPDKVTKDNLRTYFEKYNANEEKIELASIYVRNLNGWVPKWCGLWHEFTVVKSTNWYWSFEKFADVLLIQRAKAERDVKEYELGVKRKGKIEPEGRPTVKGKPEQTIQDVIKYMDEGKFLDRTHHLTKDNCHHFASLVYEFFGGYTVEEWKKKKK